MITKKWTHIRDSWVKSMKYGYDEKTKLPPKPYVYHDELKFLQKILRCRRRRFDFAVPSFGRVQEGKQESTQDQFENRTDGQESNEATEITMDVELKHQLSQEQIIQADDDSNDWLGDGTQSSATELKRESGKAVQENEMKQHSQQQKIQLRSPRSLVAAKLQFSENGVCDTAKADDNRHWNFFKGILPSLNTLDDDHTLQFQAGAITLLQKLKASQKELTDPPKKLRKIPSNDDRCMDYEWPMHKVDLPKRYSTRAAKAAADPIANQGEEEELNSGSVDVDYY